MKEAPLQKLKRLVSESENIRSGHLSGKKKKIAKKMRKSNPFSKWQEIDRKHIRGNYPPGYKENNE